MKKYSVHVFSTLLIVLSIVQCEFARSQTAPIRVLCVGNSITEGSNAGTPATVSYPAQLGLLLGSGYSVMNAGVSGRTLMKSGDYPIWNEQKFKDGLTFLPDIVTISLGTNDTKPWNWDAHKGEFIRDYKAMIDTFRSLASHPAVWLCLPPPSFSDGFSIRDSVINADIIPMIRQIELDKNCQLIDFNVLMKSHSDLVPDGIHPNMIGYRMMAEYIYGRLKGKTIQQVKDENCAAGKNVTVSGALDPLVDAGTYLVDGNVATQWRARGFPSSAVIDLGSEQLVDLFRLDFGTAAAANAGYQFTIETAGTAGTYRTLVDRMTRMDSAAVLLDKTDTIMARYVRLAITGAARPMGDTVSVAEFRVLKANGGAHAPVIYLQPRTSSSPLYVKFDMVLYWPAGATGALMVYRQSTQGGLTLMTSAIAGSSIVYRNIQVRIGDVNSYYAVSFWEGVETVSDTLVVNTTLASAVKFAAPPVPAGITVLDAYPNPFNPSTTLSFVLGARMFLTLGVYDALGKKVTDVVSEELPAGSYSRLWNTDGLPSGTYFYRVQGGSFAETRKLLLLR
jgi:lysophospholipase L1-like esterase